MSEKFILEIRETIEAAREQEAKNHTLQRYIEDKLPSLHKNIALPQGNSTPALIEFITRYIEHVPDFLAALTEMTKEAGIYDYTKSFFEIVEDYFLNPPQIVCDQHSGLHALIDEAYLAHRLIEELNDRMLMVMGSPLIPMDMTISNIVIHEILGEEFANQLDLAVHYSTEVLFKEETLENNDAFTAYANTHKSRGWSQELKQWPCLAGDSSISLRLSLTENGSQTSSKTLH